MPGFQYQEDLLDWLAVLALVPDDPNLSSPNGQTTAEAMAQLYLLALQLPHRPDGSGEGGTTGTTGSGEILTYPPRRPQVSDPPSITILTPEQLNAITVKGIPLRAPELLHNIQDDSKWQKNSLTTYYVNKVWTSQAVQLWWDGLSSPIWGMLDNTQDQTVGKMEAQNIDGSWVEITGANIDSLATTFYKSFKFTVGMDGIHGAASAFFGKANLVQDRMWWELNQWDHTKAWRPTKFRATWLPDNAEKHLYGTGNYEWDMLGDWSAARYSGEEIPVVAGEVADAGYTGIPVVNMIRELFIESVSPAGIKLQSMEFFGMDPAEFYQIGHVQPSRITFLGFNGATGLLNPGPIYIQTWPAVNPFTCYYGFDAIIDWANTDQNAQIQGFLDLTVYYAEWDGQPPYHTGFDISLPNNNAGDLRVMTSVENRIVRHVGTFYVYAKEFPGDALYTILLGTQTFDIEFVPESMAFIRGETTVSSYKFNVGPCVSTIFPRP